MRVPCGSGSRGMSEEFESQDKDISVFMKLRHLSLVKLHINAIIDIYMQARQCNLETFWLLGRKEDVDDESIGTKSVSGKKSLSRDSTRVAAQK